MIEHNGYLFIEVPEYGLCAIQTIHRPLPVLYSCEPSSTFRTELPPGQWEIIGKASEVTYQVEMDIVEFKKTFGYRKYDAVNGAYQWVSNANDSFVSLLKSHGMKSDTTLILKLKNDA